MKIITTFILLALFLTGCKIDIPSQLEGYWVSDDLSLIIQVNQGYTEYIQLSEDKSLTKVNKRCNHKKIDNQQIVLNCKLTGYEDQIVNFDKTSQKLKIEDEGAQVSFKKVPQLKIEDLMGVWTDEDVDQNIRSVYVNTQRENDYDLEIYEIDEQTKNYRHIKDLELEITLKEGFIFSEMVDGEELLLYIVDYNPDSYTVVDQTGFAWTSQRFKGDMKQTLQSQGYYPQK